MVRKNKSAPTEAADKELPRAFQDHNSRTCVALKEHDGVISYVALNDGLGRLDVMTATKSDFMSRYTPIPGYPVERALQLIIEFSRTMGATPEFLTAVGQHAPLPDYLRSEIMATTEKRKRSAVAAEEAAAKKGRKAKDPAEKPEKKSAPAKKSTAKTAKSTKTKEPGQKRQSAAQLFQDLIMEGKKTDDQIFAEVQSAYGLDDGKRGYVKWYRNKLTKDGMNPPAAKE